MGSIFADLVKTFLFFIAVIDPLGTVPVFLEATKQFDSALKKKIAIRATIIAGIILTFFILLGQLMMSLMHISLAAFQVSGGVILFLFSLTMIFGEGRPQETKLLIKDHTHITIFPIAIPGIASPAAIMAVVLLTDNKLYNIGEQAVTTLMVYAVLIATCGLLIIARKIQDGIGEGGITIISKVMGLLISAFAVQNILSGIKDYYGI
jgi:multiple antibiotic resistance protein